MNRHFISHQCIQTSEGELPKYLFIAGDSEVTGVEGFIYDLGMHRLPNPMDSFISGLQDQAHGLYEVACDLHATKLRLWDIVIQTANTPPAKIAKLGEVWEYVGGLETARGFLYYVRKPPALCTAVSLCRLDTGVPLTQTGKPVQGGIQLERPDDWTCHGLLTDLIAKGKA